MCNRTRWLLAGLLALTVSLAGGHAGEKEELVDNPWYKHWAGFKKGTVVVHTEKTVFGGEDKDEAPGGVDEKTITYKLLRVTPRVVVVETVVVEKEFLSRIEAAPTKIFYPAKVNKAHLDAVLLEAGAKHGTETVKVRVGKEEQEIKCKTLAGTRKKKGEEIKHKFWYSSTIPGGVVKRTRTTTRDGNLVAETTITLRAYKVAEE